jgi:hypothetical protein
MPGFFSITAILLVNYQSCRGSRISSDDEQTQQIVARRIRTAIRAWDPNEADTKCEAWCSDGDGTIPPTDEDVALLRSACHDLRHCLEIVSVPETIAKYPNLNGDWCLDTFTPYADGICQGQEHENGVLILGSEVLAPGFGHYEMMLKVMQIVSDANGEEEAFQLSPLSNEEDFDTWRKEKREECALPPGATNNCHACTSPDHREGNVAYQVTSIACEWNAVDQKCESTGQPDGEALVILNSCEVEDSSYGADEYASSSASSMLEEVRAKEAVNATTATAAGPDRAGPGGQVRTKALLIGFSYKKDRNNYLAGTIPDVVNVYNHLVEERGFNSADITVIIDDRRYDVSFRGARLPHVESKAQLLA